MKKKSALTKGLFLWVIFILIFTAAGCQGKIQEATKTGMYFDTVISITVYDEEADTLLEECFDLCEAFEQLLSRTIETSEISQINDRPAGTTEMKVSVHTAAVLKRALEFSELSGGAFDVTIAPVSALWDFTAETPALPDAEMLQALLPAVDYKALRLEEDTLYFSSDDTQIDLGAIAKGYIADQLKVYLEAEGVEYGIIRLGGNILCIGTKPDSSPYRIGVQDPFSEKNKAILALSVTDQSVVTSGVYERCFTLDNKLYHHLLNPKTGYPFDNSLASVTILSDSSMDGDAFSTTCFALGLEDGMALINETEGVEAIFITEDGELHYSDGAKQYI